MKNKKIKKIKKNQIGGTNIISASTGLVKSMIQLGDSIFTEIHSITNIKSDIDNGASASPSTDPPPPGTTTEGPPPFTQPNLS